MSNHEGQYCHLQSKVKHWFLYCAVQAIEFDMKSVDMATENMIHLLNIFLMSNSSDPLFFPLLPWLPKWPKQNSSFKMWPIDQLYIELGGVPTASWVSIAITGLSRAARNPDLFLFTVCSVWKDKTWYVFLFNSCHCAKLR